MRAADRILAQIPIGGLPARKLRLKFPDMPQVRYDAVMADLVAGWRISINRGSVRRVTQRGGVMA